MCGCMYIHNLVENFNFMHLSKLFKMFSKILCNISSGGTLKSEISEFSDNSFQN